MVKILLCLASHSRLHSQRLWKKLDSSQDIHEVILKQPSSGKVTVKQSHLPKADAYNSYTVIFHNFMSKQVYNTDQ